MEKQTKSIIIIAIVLIVILVVFKSCYRTKNIEFKQKSSDQKSTYSVEIKKEKPEEKKDQTN